MGGCLSVDLGVGLFGLGEHHIKSLDVGVQGQDVSGVRLIGLNELVLGRDVVLHELVDLDVAVVVLVALLEQFVNNFLAVVLINALVGQELIHLALVDAAVAVNVDGRELVPQFLEVLVSGPRVVHFQINLIID